MGTVDQAGSLFEDFTYRAYRETLTCALAKYPFKSFADAPAERYVFWRHDIDFSIQAALRLARIEAAFGARCTYFVLLSSSAYNALSSPSLRMLKEIAALGHWIGLHYDAELDGVSTVGALNDRLSDQRKLLESRLGTRVSAFSFHNPTAQVSQFDAPSYGGMVNAYSKDIRESTLYCSDSNGVWRYANVHEFVRDTSSDRIHVLTHPEWWTLRPMSPRKRLFETLAEDRLEVLRDYNVERQAHSRPNLFELQTAFESIARTEAGWALKAEMIWLQGPPATAFLHIWARTRKKIRLATLMQVRQRFGTKSVAIDGALSDRSLADRVHDIFLQASGTAGSPHASEMARIFNECQSLASELTTGVDVPGARIIEAVGHCARWLELAHCFLSREPRGAADRLHDMPPTGTLLDVFLKKCDMPCGDAAVCVEPAHSVSSRGA